jgi:hypothetical protein
MMRTPFERALLSTTSQVVVLARQLPGNPLTCAFAQCANDLLTRSQASSAFHGSE